MLYRASEAYLAYKVNKVLQANWDRKDLKAGKDSKAAMETAERLDQKAYE